MEEYEEIVARINALFVGVIDLTELTVLAYEPETIHSTPLMYSLLADVTFSEDVNWVTTSYRIMHRLAFLWTDNERAELELLPYVNAIRLAVEADPRLGGYISGKDMGAQIVTAEGGFANINGTIYRVVDFFSETLTERKVSNPKGPCE